MNSLTQIRSVAIGKANRLQRAARHLDSLRPAFAEWSAGEIYVCKRTGTYRYRFGERSKSVAPWDSVAREVFATPAAFAFAAMVLAPEPTGEEPEADDAPTQGGERTHAAETPTRGNIIALASAHQEAA